MGSGKFGFHLAQGGNATGIGELYRRVQEAGRKPYAMVANDTGRANEVLAHGGEVAFRWTGPEFEYLDYDLTPYDAAMQHVNILQARIFNTPDFDPRAWIVSVNEPDRNKSQWIAVASEYIGFEMMSRGYKWLAGGWSAGTPEPEDWPEWEGYFRLCAAYPSQLGLALHEYTLSLDYQAGLNPMQWNSPHLIGRFQYVHQICDSLGIARPPIWITEFGWTHERVPSPIPAIEQIQWAWDNIYSGYSNIHGIAIWYLGPGFGGIADQAQRLIAPLTDWLVNTNFDDPPPPPPPSDPLYPVFLESIEVQTACGIQLNPNAGLQQAILKYVDPSNPGQWIPVHREYYSGLVNAVVQAGENLSNGARRIFVWRDTHAEIGPAYFPPYGQS